MIMCENAHMNHKMLYAAHVAPQCYDNKATKTVTIQYNETYPVTRVESDVRHLCNECAKLFSKDARRYGYKVKSNKL